MNPKSARPGEITSSVTLDAQDAEDQLCGVLITATAVWLLLHASVSSSSRQQTMDAHNHDDLLDRLLHPSKENAHEILSELGLASLPSREQVHRQIEEKLLLPQDKFPEHWLPLYQA